jgi:asparagine synthase (glutamine-hydrolysing)
MCGICGVVGKADEQLIKNMLARIDHRGPDDEGVYIAETSQQERIGLGHRRLSIIDLSPAGHEPMSDSRGEVWLTYNGEIYNFKEIRSQLGGTWTSIQIQYRRRSNNLCISGMGL